MMEVINWADQWSHHAHGFCDGKAHIPLDPEKTFALLPGPGFGDYSHPTTRLMLQMMTPYVNGMDVFDIGCGSGILSVAAALLGARSVSICDIDPLALEHAKRNAQLNDVTLQNGKPSSEDTVVLMNMIASEQAIAWAENQVPFSVLITSGILETQRESYLAFAHTCGWKREAECALEGWLGFIWRKNCP